MTEATTVCTVGSKAVSAPTVCATSCLRVEGDICFTPSNPLFRSPSYIQMCGGLYVSGGTLYSQVVMMARGGICRDNSDILHIYGGTNSGGTCIHNITYTPSLNASSNIVVAGRAQPKVACASIATCGNCWIKTNLNPWNDFLKVLVYVAGPNRHASMVYCIGGQNSYSAGANDNKWNCVCLAEFRGYNFERDDVCVMTMSNTNTSGYAGTSVVLKLNCGASDDYTTHVTAEGMNAHGLSLSSASSQPYTYCMANSCCTAGFYGNTGQFILRRGFRSCAAACSDVSFTAPIVCATNCIRVPHMCSVGWHYIANEIGLYWSGSCSMHLYPATPNCSTLHLRSSDSAQTRITLTTNNNLTPRGSVQANSSNQIGFLDAGNHWAYLAANDLDHNWYLDNGTRHMFMCRASAGTASAMLCVCGQICSSGTVHGGGYNEPAIGSQGNNACTVGSGCTVTCIGELGSVLQGASNVRGMVWTGKHWIVTTYDADRAWFFDSSFNLICDKNGHCYKNLEGCLLYTSPSPRDATLSRMPSSA